MEAAIERTPDCRLVRIDIRTWHSAVARQYGIRSLPTVWLYRDGQRVTADSREALASISRLGR